MKKLKFGDKILVFFDDYPNEYVLGTFIKYEDLLYVTGYNITANIHHIPESMDILDTYDNIYWFREQETIFLAEANSPIARLLLC